MIDTKKLPRIDYNHLEEAYMERLHDLLSPWAEKRRRGREKSQEPQPETVTDIITELEDKTLQLMEQIRKGEDRYNCLRIALELVMRSSYCTGLKLPCEVKFLDWINKKDGLKDSQIENLMDEIQKRLNSLDQLIAISGSISESLDSEHAITMGQKEKLREALSNLKINKEDK